MQIKEGLALSNDKKLQQILIFLATLKNQDLLLEVELFSFPITYMFKLSNTERTNNVLMRGLMFHYSWSYLDFPQT